MAGVDGGGKLALVMAGGGARAAYQVGVLRYVASIAPELPVPCLTGVSAGAINAVHLARRPDSFASSVERLTELWMGLRTENVLSAQTAPLVGNVMRWGMRLVSGGASSVPTPRAMVDTAPLRRFLREHVGMDGQQGAEAGIPGIAENLASGRLDALAVTTTSYATGQSITWVQGREVEMWERGFRRSERCEITIDHVMASAALPLLFPAVKIGDEWHGDGGIRHAAPLSPALHLGADRIFAIATRRTPLPRAAAPEKVQDYPPPAQIMGILMNAIFLDLIDYDAANMMRVSDLTARLPAEQRRGFRRTELLVLRPSEDIGAMAAEHEVELPGALRFLTRGWGTREAKAADSLAMLLFEPGYIGRLIDLGEHDARARGDEIARFLEVGARVTVTGWDTAR